MGVFFFGKDKNMTVQKTYIKNKYIGDGKNTLFPITFEWPKDHPEFIQAWVKDAGGKMVQTDNFALQLQPNTEEWNVVYPNNGEPLEAGAVIVIARELPLQQILNLVNQGPYFAEDIEVTFDEVVMMVQQINERVGRSFKVGVDIDGENSFDTTVPIEPGKTFRVNDAGTGFEVTEDPGKVIDSAKELLKQTTAQAEFANEQAVNAQNAATSVQKYKALWFDSVASMKAEPSLTAGAYVCTAGYYEPNDGGGASYLISAKADTDVDDGGSIHELQNGLVAELLIENGTVCPKQFGAKGDGEKSVALNKYWKYCDNMDLLMDELSNGTIHDDTDAINLTLRSGKKVVFDNKTYIITDTLLINSNVFVDFNYARIVMVTNKNIIEVVGRDSTINNAFLCVADYNTFSKSGVYFGDGETENIVFNNLKIYNYKSVVCESVVNNIKTSQDVHTENIGGVGIYVEKLKSNTVSRNCSLCNCHFNDFYIYGFATGIKMYVEDRSTNFPWISTNFFKGKVWFSRHCLDIGRESKKSFNQVSYFDLIYQFSKYFPSEVLNVVDQDKGDFKIFMWDVPSTIKFCYNYGFSNIFRFNPGIKKIIDFSDDRNMFVETPLTDEVSHNQKYIMNLDKYGGIVENGEFVLVNRVYTAQKTTLMYAFGADKFKLRTFKITYDVFIEGEAGDKAVPTLLLNFVDGAKKIYGYLTDNNKYTINEFDDETKSFIVNDVTGLSVNNSIRPTIYSSEGVVYNVPDIAPNSSPYIKISNIDVDSKRIYYKSNTPQQSLDIFKDCKAFVKDFSNAGNYIPTYICLASEKDHIAYIPCNTWWSTDNIIMCSGYFTNCDDFTISLSFMSVQQKELKSCKIKNLCIDYL